MHNLTQMERKLLKYELKNCQQILNTFGNKTRQGIICAMLEVDYKGMRIGEIAHYSQFSRPAVTHHLKILLATEMIGRYSKSNRSYYYIKLGGEWQKLVALINLAERLRLKEAKDTRANISQ